MDSPKIPKIFTPNPHIRNTITVEELREHSRHLTIIFIEDLFFEGELAIVCEYPRKVS